MPKIRKKTSARQSTRMKNKISHKAAETKRKNKKAAKKDITWKSKARKDPGIPNILPFKQEIIQEQQQRAAEREESKLARRELLASSLAKVDLDQDQAEPEAEDTADQEQDISNLSTFAKSLSSVISSCDVLLQVLDARDPTSTRTLSLEKQVINAGKKLVLILNKVDLVPKENVEKWLKYLRRSFVTLPFKSTTQLQATRLQSNNTSTALLKLMKSFTKGKTLTIGVIGQPNVGKSSLINTLRRKKACSVAPTPGYTKTIQSVSLEAGLKIMDCPGVVYNTSTSTSEAVLNNTISLDSIQDLTAPIEALLQKCNKQHLMLLYNIPIFNTTQEFLHQVARAKGRLKKGGLPDLTGTAKTIIRDWTSNRIPYYTIPPPVIDIASTSGTTGDQSKATDQILSEFSPEFDLDALFREADGIALSDNSVSQSVAVKASHVETSLEEGDAKFLGEDSQSDDDGDVDMRSELNKSGTKRKATEELKVVALNPTKRVTFQERPSKMFSAEEEELLNGSIGQNKAIAKRAKKLKKKELKEGKNAIEVDGDGAVEDEIDALASGLEARTKAMTVSQVENAADENQAYDFNAFFGIKSKLPLDQHA